MTRTPKIWTAQEIQAWDVAESSDGTEYRPSRPMDDGFRHPFWHRWKVAFGVLVGKYDALDWGEPT